MDSTIPGTPTNPAASPTVAMVQTPGQSANASIVSSAQDTATRLGGNPNGKARKDGLVPGSPQAIEADKKKDRERKQAARNAKPGVPLPALPSASAGTVPVLATGGSPVAGVGPEVSTFKPWTPDMVKPVFENLLPLAEDLAKAQVSTKAGAANLPPEIVRDIVNEYKWDPFAKKAIELSGPSACADAMNKIGISSEYKDVTVLAIALTKLVAGHCKVMSRLDELIELQKGQLKKPQSAPAK